jgi:hypothetical protein
VSWSHILAFARQVHSSRTSLGSRTMPPTSSRSAPFPKDHEIKYGVKILEKDTDTNQVTSARCQFCVYFGKKQDPGSKRQRLPTNNVKSWTIPFRPELNVSHHSGQHPKMWEEYQSLLDPVEQKNFFAMKTPFVNTMHVYSAPSAKQLEFTIRPEIVDCIIGDSFFDPEKIGGVSHSRII